DGDLRLRHHAVVGGADQTHQGRHPDAALPGQVIPARRDAGRLSTMPPRIRRRKFHDRSRGNEMPVYEYLCNDCGPFTDMRPMAECDDPQACPRCEISSPRVILTAPNFFCMPSDRRKAIATNERSTHAP